MPRVRNSNLTEVIIAIGRSREGAEFDSLDRAPVHIVIPILAPLDTEEQKEVLEQTAICLLADEAFRNCVRTADDLPDVLRAIDEW